MSYAQPPPEDYSYEYVENQFIQASSWTQQNPISTQFTTSTVPYSQYVQSAARTAESQYTLDGGSGAPRLYSNPADHQGNPQVNLPVTIYDAFPYDIPEHASRVDNQAISQGPRAPFETYGGGSGYNQPLLDSLNYQVGSSECQIPVRMFENDGGYTQPPSLALEDQRASVLGPWPNDPSYANCISPEGPGYQSSSMEYAQNPSGGHAMHQSYFSNDGQNNIQPVPVYDKVEVQPPSDRYATTVLSAPAQSIPDECIQYGMPAISHSWNKVSQSGPGYIDRTSFAFQDEMISVKDPRSSSYNAGDVIHNSFANEPTGTEHFSGLFDLSAHSDNSRPLTGGSSPPPELYDLVAEAKAQRLTCANCAVGCVPQPRKNRKKGFKMHEKLEQKYFDAVTSIYKLGSYKSQRDQVTDQWATLSRGFTVPRLCERAGANVEQQSRLTAFYQRLKQQYHVHSKWCLECNHNAGYTELGAQFPLRTKEYGDFVKGYNTIEEHFNAIEEIVEGLKKIRWKTEWRYPGAVANPTMTWATGSTVCEPGPQYPIEGDGLHPDSLPDGLSMWPAGTSSLDPQIWNDPFDSGKRSADPSQTPVLQACSSFEMPSYERPVQLPNQVSGRDEYIELWSEVVRNIGQGEAPKNATALARVRMNQLSRWTNTTEDSQTILKFIKELKKVYLKAGQGQEGSVPKASDKLKTFYQTATLAVAAMKNRGNVMAERSAQLEARKLRKGKEFRSKEKGIEDL